MTKLITALIVLVAVVCSNAPLAKTYRFSDAKKHVYQLDQGGTTLYCGCKYSQKRVNFSSCGFQPRKNAFRAKRTEIEHIMPAWQIGHNLKCWREPICAKSNGKHYKGRKCCEKISKTFREAYTDLNNLFVVVGEVNADRNNYRFSQWNEKPYQYGSCQSVTDFKRHQFMPRAESRGVVARAMLHMSKTYDIPLSKSQKRLFLVWDKQYPLSQWEMKRAAEIAKITKN